MSDNKYNGWSNRETWLVNIHLNPESVNDMDYIKDQVQEWYDSLNPFMQDMVDIDCIDWDELEQAMDDYEQEDEEE
jgi:hypothetical protein